jgi:hypothetical protein
MRATKQSDENVPSPPHCSVPHLCGQRGPWGKKNEALNMPKSHWTLRAFGGTLEGTSEPMACDRSQVSDGGRGVVDPSCLPLLHDRDGANQLLRRPF